MLYFHWLIVKKGPMEQFTNIYTGWKNINFIYRTAIVTGKIILHGIEDDQINLLGSNFNLHKLRHISAQQFGTAFQSK